MKPIDMRTLAGLARQRIVAWLGANPQITQVKLAAEIGVSQTWVSQYKTGDQDADIDQLAAMAVVFGHTVFELVDLKPHPKEQELIDAYRRLPADKRPLAVQLLESMIPPSRAPRK